ncbi:MAG: hypothetical protein Q9170_008315, partial [Blastenia crenularia]
MHPAPRTIYDRDVDFATLALQDPDFNKFLKPNAQLDFSNPQAVKQLTKSLLRRDFGVQIELPDDRLCPPVPNRFNYILWIQDLIDTTSEDFRDAYDPEREVIGLDMYACPSNHSFTLCSLPRYTDQQLLTYISQTAAPDPAVYTPSSAALNAQNGNSSLQ